MSNLKYSVLVGLIVGLYVIEFYDSLTKVIL